MKRLFKILPIILVVICSAVILTACVDADIEVQKAKLQELGYFPQDMIASGSQVDTMGAEQAYQFTLNSTSETVTVYARVFILYFSSDSDAIEFERNFINYSLANLEEYNYDVFKNYKYSRIGKIFVHGDERGYKDALS